METKLDCTGVVTQPSIAMHPVKTNTDEVEDEIIVAIDAVAANPESRQWDSATWTQKVKSAIAQIGCNREMWVCASGCDYAKDSEWLYDLAWLDYDGNYLRGASLVLESEWDPRGIDDDFQKLVLARADHRVFLFATSSNSDWCVAVEKMLQHTRISRHALEGDRYLFGAWNEIKWKFEWLPYVQQQA